VRKDDAHLIGVEIIARRPEEEAGGCDPSVQSGGSMSEQVKECMDLEHCLH
jgi:hypothetical protein